MQLQPDEQIGDYTIVGKLGQGGMSWVYLAEDRKNGTQVVVKQLREHFVFDRELVDRFSQGAQIMLQLRHPHLAKVFDYIERNGDYFMVEEYLSGGSLADLLEKGEPFSEQEAMRWCRDALQAIDYTHQNFIVHRDLKPGNLMLNEKREVKVTDFGIAKVFSGPRLTKTGTEMGTAYYMSPEQIRSPHKVDHLTDVYSMGVVLYELLTGAVPFNGDTDYDVKEKVVRQPAPSPRQRKAQISRCAERIVLKAMQKRPGDRFGGCAEFALAIDKCLQGIVEHPWVRMTLVAAAVVVLAVVLFLLRPPTLAVTATKTKVRAGGSTQLGWKTQRAERVRIEPDIGDVELEGSREVKPLKSTTYVATATGRWRTSTEEVNITVVPAVKGIVELNPIPWAKVVSIKNTDGTAADSQLILPAETPLRIELRPGDYLIALKSYNGQEQSVRVSVQAGNTTTWNEPIGGFNVGRTVNEMLQRQ